MYFRDKTQGRKEIDQKEAIIRPDYTSFPPNHFQLNLPISLPTYLPTYLPPQAQDDPLYMRTHIAPTSGIQRLLLHPQETLSMGKTGMDGWID